jgi:hypothetical protein
MLGAPGEDGVFRYTPSPVEADLPKPEDDSAEVAEWFNTKSDPEIAQAVAQAVAEARVPDPGAIDGPRQYAPLSQQAQPPASDYSQPPASRHGNRDHE